MSSHRTKEDHVFRLSKSIFITNFPDNFGSSDLWKLCETYGKVVDVYIPNRKSKAGKRFAFVRFIKVDDVDRLVGNLCTLWVGHFHLHANVFRFERPSKYPKPAGYTQPKGYSPPGSFVNVVKGNSSNVPLNPFPASPSLVLDDSCVNVRDLSRNAMGGMWVMIELVNESTKNKLLQHTKVKSWFQVLQPAIHDFVSEERVVWVDIEGVPLNLWSRETFIKIVIFHGKVYMACAKELFVWTLNFLDYKEPEYFSDDEPLLNVKNNSVGPPHGDDALIDDSDVEGVSNTIFDDNHASPAKSVCQSSEKAGEQQSEDIFSLYDLLNKYPKGVVNDSDPSLSHPHGFTPEVSRHGDDHIGADNDIGIDKANSPLVHLKV
ncbi:RNA-directed DNA polymerase, eukaryota, partial [Tanacetum coccineum]